MDPPYTLHSLNEKVVRCRLCSRLDNYIRQIGRTKVKRHLSEEYWARPLPSFGDPAAKLLIIGLAPAAHGGNRTGRMFTGDSSGDWLFKAMYETGFASQPNSRANGDGLVLFQAYVTAAVRCAPPGNKPLPDERANCAPYLQAEIELLDDVQVIITLGRIAFNAYCKSAALNGLVFSHGASIQLDGKVLLCSYHPSRQNTNTGRLTWPMWIDVFKQARKLVDSKK